VLRDYDKLSSIISSIEECHTNNLINLKIELSNNSNANGNVSNSIGSNYNYNHNNREEGDNKSKLKNYYQINDQLLGLISKFEKLKTLNFKSEFTNNNIASGIGGVNHNNYYNCYGYDNYKNTLSYKSKINSIILRNKDLNFSEVLLKSFSNNLNYLNLTSSMLNLDIINTVISNCNNLIYLDMKFNSDHDDSYNYIDDLTNLNNFVGRFRGSNSNNSNGGGDGESKLNYFLNLIERLNLKYLGIKFSFNNNIDNINSNNISNSINSNDSNNNSNVDHYDNNLSSYLTSSSSSSSSSSSDYIIQKYLKLIT